MAITETSVGELVEREDRALAAVVALAEEVDPALPVGDGAWSARDVFAHLVTVIRRYTDPNVRLASTPREVDRVNAEEMAALAGESVTDLVDLLTGGHAAYQRVWATLSLDRELPFHAGLRLDVAALRANWLGELLLHGRDVAAAAGRPATLDERDALLTMLVLLRGLPGYLRPADAGAVEVALRVDGGTPQSLVVDGSTLTIADGAPPSPDCTVSGPAPAVSLLLYGRLDLAGAEAAGLAVTGDRAAFERFLASRELP